MGWLGVVRLMFCSGVGLEGGVGISNASFRLTTLHFFSFPFSSPTHSAHLCFLFRVNLTSVRGDMMAWVLAEDDDPSPNPGGVVDCLSGCGTMGH